MIDTTDSQILDLCYKTSRILIDGNMESNLVGYKQDNICFFFSFLMGKHFTQRFVGPQVLVKKSFLIELSSEVDSSFWVSMSKQID